jgi:hypothetical protein
VGVIAWNLGTEPRHGWIAEVRGERERERERESER